MLFLFSLICRNVPLGLIHWVALEMKLEENVQVEDSATLSLEDANVFLVLLDQDAKRSRLPINTGNLFISIPVSFLFFSLFFFLLSL